MNTTAQTIARKIARQQERRIEAIARAGGTSGALDLQRIAGEVAHIDGRIDGLTEALEVILGVDTVTYDVIERLVATGA